MGAPIWLRLCADTQISVPFPFDEARELTVVSANLPDLAACSPKTSCFAKGLAARHERSTRFLPARL